LFLQVCPNAGPAPPTYEDMFAKREMRVKTFFLQKKSTERRLKIKTVRFESIRPLEFEGKRHGRPGVDSSTFSPQASLAVSTKLACQKRAGSTKPFWCHPRLMAARIVPTGSHRLYLVLFPCASRRCSRCLDLIPVDQRLQKWYLHGRRSRITDAVLDCLSVDE